MASKKLLFFLFLTSFFIQEGLTQESKKIEILNADDLIFDNSSGIKAKRLVGNVILKHENSLMYCDSAHVVNETNSMKAFSNVRIEEDDSVEMKGDYLEYEGNSKLAYFEGNVQMKHKDMILSTQSMTYDRSRNMGFYLKGGELLTNDGNDTLWSKKGYYFSDNQEARFRDSVRLRSKDYQIESDTLHYLTSEDRSLFFGPTNIYSGTDVIYCEAGWSNNKTQESQFQKNAQIFSGDQVLRGDTIYFDNELKIGRAFGNISIEDSTQNFTVMGERAWHDADDSISIVTHKALMIQIESGDSLFLHGDSLVAFYDTNNQRVILAYNHVKLYKSDMAGMCDSLAFSDADSSIKMFNSPIIWSEGNQITADYIQINRNGGKVESMDILENAFIISSSDSTRYDQIAGKNMKAFFKDNSLKRVNVLEEGKTIYYAMENDTNVIGLNVSSCDEKIVIKLDSSKVQEILFYAKPNSILYPEEQWTPEIRFMKGFKWYDAYRPRRREDVFIEEVLD